MTRRPCQTKRDLKERLAAVLRDLMVEVDGKLERAIPYEHAKQMTADDVIAKFEFDHGIHRAVGGPDVHWNYTARLVAEHRRKTAKIDIPQIAKTKRVAASHACHVAKTSLNDAEADAKPPRPKSSRRSMKSRDDIKFNWKTKRYEKVKP